MSLHLCEHYSSDHMHRNEEIKGFGYELDIKIWAMVSMTTNAQGYFCKRSTSLDM